MDALRSDSDDDDGVTIPPHEVPGEVEKGVNGMRLLVKEFPDLFTGFFELDPTVQKSNYRKACRICHEDKNRNKPKEMKEKAAEHFAALQDVIVFFEHSSDDNACVDTLQQGYRGSAAAPVVPEPAVPEPTPPKRKRPASKTTSPKKTKHDQVNDTSGASAAPAPKVSGADPLPKARYKPTKPTQAKVDATYAKIKAYIIEVEHMEADDARLVRYPLLTASPVRWTPDAPVTVTNFARTKEQNRQFYENMQKRNFTLDECVRHVAKHAECEMPMPNSAYSNVRWFQNMLGAAAQNDSTRRLFW
jgi:hypothetical protein